MKRTTAVYRFAFTRRAATEIGGSLRRFLLAPVSTKVVHNHLTIGKLNKFPRARPVPWSEKPAICSLVVRVVILGRTICWQLRASQIKFAIELASTPLDIAVALHRGAVPVAVAVHLIVLTREIFGIVVCTYGLANMQAQ